MTMKAKHRAWRILYGCALLFLPFLILVSMQYPLTAQFATNTPKQTMNPIFATSTARFATLQPRRSQTAQATLTVTADANVRYANTNANVRSCPRTSCNTLGSLLRGEAVTILDTVEGQAVNTGNALWYEIDYRGESGYVYSALLSERQPTAVPTSRAQTGSTGGQSGQPVQPQPTQVLVSTALPTVPPLISTPVPPPPAAPSFVCNCSLTCEQMTSCEEAYFQLQQCGCRRRDGDGDGVPCENLCPGG